jgi:hypothetical protein
VAPTGIACAGDSLATMAMKDRRFWIDDSGSTILEWWLDNHHRAKRDPFARD